MVDPANKKKNVCNELIQAFPLSLEVKQATQMGPSHSPDTRRLTVFSSELSGAF